VALKTVRSSVYRPPEGSFSILRKDGYVEQAQISQSQGMAFDSHPSLAVSGHPSNMFSVSCYVETVLPPHERGGCYERQ
jgi:hypothetical protein